MIAPRAALVVAPTSPAILRTVLSPLLTHLVLLLRGHVVAHHVPDLMHDLKLLLNRRLVAKIGLTPE